MVLGCLGFRVLALARPFRAQVLETYLRYRGRRYDRQRQDGDVEGYWPAPKRRKPNVRVQGLGFRAYGLGFRVNCYILVEILFC